MAVAEVTLYKSSDDTGLNKKERIDAVESYLIVLSKSLKALEDEHRDEVKKIDVLMKSHDLLKAAELKRPTAELSEKKIIPGSELKESKMKEEIEKLKSDILVLKNDDIEKLKINFQELSDTLKALQASFRSQLEEDEKKESRKSPTAK